MGQLEMFALNIRFLIGLVVFLFIALVAVIVFWTGIKTWLWRRGKRQSEAAEHDRKFGADGRPYPPVAAGMCGQCGGAFAEVFHLPDGTRKCRGCYEGK